MKPKINLSIHPRTRISSSKRSGRQRRGRKPASESRATEIRARLMEWKQAPESSRGSLRALAVEMGTSHQLLSFYLRHWEKWQAKEYLRNAKDVSARAKAENRALTGEDQAQIVAYTRAYLQSWVTSSLVPDMLATLRKEAKRGKLSKQYLRLAKVIADRGYGREIQEILATSRLGISETESLKGGKC
jgi:sulfur relay (sulfurtransferase) DsrC/TusE family protein